MEEVYNGVGRGGNKLIIDRIIQDKSELPGGAVLLMGVLAAPVVQAGE